MLHSGRRSATVALVAGAALLVSSCTGPTYDEVDLDGLASGPCAELVPALQDVDDGLRRLAEDETTPGQAAERFATVQDDLAATPAQPSVAPAVTELVTRIGFYRVAVDTGGDEAAEGTRVREALEALAQECRTA